MERDGKIAKPLFFPLFFTFSPLPKVSFNFTDWAWLYAVVEELRYSVFPRDQPPHPPLFVPFFSLFTSYYSPRILLCNPHKRIMAIIKWHHSLPRPATNFLEISTFVRRFQFLHNRFHSSIPVKCHGSDVCVAKNCCSKIFYAVS